MASCNKLELNNRSPNLEMQKEHAEGRGEGDILMSAFFVPQKKGQCFHHFSVVWLKMLSEEN